MTQSHLKSLSKDPQGLLCTAVMPISSAALTEIAALCRSMDEIDGCVPADAKQPFDMRLLLARLLDGSRLHEFKAAYGTTLITGFARIHGHQVRSGPAICWRQL